MYLLLIRSRVLSSASVASGGSSPVKKGSVEEGDRFFNRLQAKHALYENGPLKMGH